MLFSNRQIINSFCLTSILLAPLPASAQSDADEISELVVTSSRREQSTKTHAGNIDRLGATDLSAIQHQHIHELLSRISGVWLSRGSGQEHLTAIRSPVLTGGGSCGAFLFLEDGIPIRPASFCNVNSLFEINTEQAESIEVIRGPGNALYGSNALHGIINVLMPAPQSSRDPSLSFEAGANDFYRARAALPFDRASPWLASLLVADDGGFRDDSGYRQGKLHLKRVWEVRAGDFTAAFTATDLDQETAGFIQGENAYRDSTINRSNPNPEAFREASSQRLYGLWSRSNESFDLDLRPYARHTDMRFLQHFLPGQPLEENSHNSIGVIATATIGNSEHPTIVGVDIEWADIRLKQSQDGPTTGSTFLMETRPAGDHYDYDVKSVAAAAYVQAEFALGERLVVGAGLRIDRLRYDYNNRMLTGNTRDDGSACLSGGCLYSRPADRSDAFTNVAPKLTLTYELGETGVFFANLSRGFRAPQATELYRLQSGQQIADLRSERADSFELGLRTEKAKLAADVAVFAMRKRDSIFRDAEGFNVTGARSTHRGVEAALDWQITTGWLLAIDLSYARHRYDFDMVALRGETFVSGADVDTAPRWLGSLELQYEPSDRFNIGMQLTTIGKYYLDAENRFRYPGHTIANLRAGVRLTSQIDLVLRLNNVSDRDIADRADYAFGNYRYFPGRGRELFAELRYSPP